MSKQKLISAEKLQKWIDETFKKKLPTESIEYRDGRETVLDLLEMQLTIGTFNAEPVSTIKPGEIVIKDQTTSGNDDEWEIVGRLEVVKDE